MPAEDADLVRGIIKGDPDSLRHIIKRYQGPLMAFASRLLVRRQDAEDVVQETFVRLFKKSKTLKEPAKLKSWLYVVTANQARNLVRQRNLRKLFSLDFLLEAGLDPLVGEGEVGLPQPQAQAEAAQLWAWFEGQSRRLPMSLRAPLVLIVFENKGEDEVAEILGLSLNAVRVRLARARKRLWKAFERAQNR